MPQDPSGRLQQALEAIVAEVATTFPVHRASVRLIEGESAIRIAALWTDGPTLLGRDLSYQSTATSLDEVLHATGPMVRQIDPQRDLVEALLWEDGLKVYASVPVYAGGRLAGLLSLSSRDRDAFSQRDLSPLVRASERISAVLEQG
jgi:GAF domain-containing protein